MQFKVIPARNVQPALRAIRGWIDPALISLKEGPFPDILRDEASELTLENEHLFNPSDWAIP